VLKPSEKAKIADQLTALFKTFQSSRTIEREAIVFYVEDTAEYSVPAIEEAIRRFRRGEVEDRNPDFAPSVAAFVTEVREAQERIDVAAFWDKTDFIEFDSAEWRALCRQRGRSMPVIERRGKQGWYVPKDEVAALPPQIVAEERKFLESFVPAPSLPMLPKMGA